MVVQHFGDRERVFCNLTTSMSPEHHCTNYTHVTGTSLFSARSFNDICLLVETFQVYFLH